MFLSSISPPMKYKIGYTCTCVLYLTCALKHLISIPGLHKLPLSWLYLGVLLLSWSPCCQPSSDTDPVQSPASLQWESDRHCIPIPKNIHLSTQNYMSCNCPVILKLRQVIWFYQCIIMCINTWLQLTFQITHPKLSNCIIMWQLLQILRYQCKPLL